MEERIPPLTDAIAWRWRRLDKVTSTQDIVRREAEAGAAAGLILCANWQSAGRGRLQRRWESAPGAALLCSLLVRPIALPAQQAAHLTMITALALADAVAETAGVQPDIKWPNDLYLQGRKLAGILTETQIDANNVQWAVIGFGLNLRRSFPEGHPLARQSIALAEVCGAVPERETLLRAVVLHLAASCRRRRAGWSPHRAWQQRLLTLGREVTVTAGAKRWHGTAVGTTSAGALQLRLQNGSLREIWAGEVTLSASIGD